MHNDTNLIIAGVAVKPIIVTDVNPTNGELTVCADVVADMAGGYVALKYIPEIVRSEIKHVDPVVVQRVGFNKQECGRIAQLETELKLRNDVIEGLQRDAAKDGEQFSACRDEKDTEISELKRKLGVAREANNDSCAASVQHSVYRREKEKEIAALELEIDEANRRHAETIHEMRSKKIENMVPRAHPAKPVWCPVPTAVGSYVYWTGRESDELRVVSVAITSDGFPVVEGNDATAGYYLAIEMPEHPKC